MIKILLVLFILLNNNYLNTQTKITSSAEGFFLAFGVGPRIPVFDFYQNSDVGLGLNCEFTYTNTDVLPIFFYSKFGFDQFPGSQSFYRASDYSNFNTRSYTVNIGLRRYYSPMIENIALFMPFIQAGISYVFFQKLHEFKVDRGHKNYLEENSKLGVTLGGGISMFMMEVLGSYNILKSNNYLTFDLKVRIPIFISL